MQQKLQKWVAASVITLGCLGTLNAQTISTLDDLTLPTASTDFASIQTAAGDYTFQSGNVKFFGVRESWGGYGAFNYTNVVDTTTASFTNDRAAITGKGYNNSANYGVAYLTQDYPAHPKQSLLIGAKLQGTAVGSKVVGTYLTNTTYAYSYMKDNYHTGDSLSLVIRGYLNNVKTTDSVIFHLAKYTTTDTTLLKTWKWVNLLPLGNVDSVTFQIFSTDEIAPYYMAFDNFTTLDGVCPTAVQLIASSVNENSATITWTDGIANLPTNYQVAVDQTATLAPSAATATSTTHTHTATALSPNTQYYAHVRATCPDGGFSDWDTANFKTLQATGIATTNKNNLNVVISPNPAQNFIHVDVKTAVTASIYSLEGKLLNTIENAQQIDISALSAGTYILRVVDNKDYTQSATLRFIKNH